MILAQENSALAATKTIANLMRPMRLKSLLVSLLRGADGDSEYDSDGRVRSTVGGGALELTPFHGHLIVPTEGVRSVQTTHTKAALSGTVS